MKVVLDDRLKELMREKNKKDIVVYTKTCST